jgi:putative endonuclease
VAFVYVLRSRSSGRFYIGSTTDLQRRLAEHARGHSPSTRDRGPWELVYQEEYAELAQARRRERQMKSWKSHRLIQQLIESQAQG